MRHSPAVGDVVFDCVPLLKVFWHVVVQVPRDLEVERVEGDGDRPNVGVDDVLEVAGECKEYKQGAGPIAGIEVPGQSCST